MASFNKVLLMGNLTRDPQLRYLPNQTAVVDFGMACNRRWKGAGGEDREEVTFVDCSAFGRQAEVINQYCTKGRPLFIEGRLKFDQWEDKQGGGKRSRLSIVVENFQLLGGREGGPGAGGGPGGAGAGGHEPGDEADQRPRAQTRPPGRGGPPQRPQGGPPAERPQQEPPYGDEQQFKEDDIPF